ncbi:hypothetical protein [Wolbachia endosymbiont of Aedes albopictus]|nr:hypothetical protein [Wolbachia endosymbiont of Aedes albopictus]UVW83928.1 hypothetical protein NHG98_00130 [Wolbachia endosymbiont of Aedes albopictus]
MNRGMTVCGGMTVRGGMKVKQFVIPLLVSGIYCRDTANESRYDGS